MIRNKKIEIMEEKKAEDKRRNSRKTSGSLDILSIKNSLNKTRRSIPLILLLKHKLKTIFQIQKLLLL